MEREQTRSPSISASGSSGECKRVPVERVTSTGDNEGPATIETEKRAARWPPRSGAGGRRREQLVAARRSERRTSWGCGMGQMMSPGRQGVREDGTPPFNM